MSEELFVWPGTAPGSENVVITEHTNDDRDDPDLPNRSITGITSPSLTLFVPEQPKGTGALVMPGGGYTKLVFDKEGTDIARWLVSLGITAFVLISRLPGVGHKDGKNVPLQDAQRAMRLIRSQADRWSLDPQRLGAVGLSSGGHLAAMLGTNFNKKVYAPVDGIDEKNARPDFLVIGYAPLSTNARHTVNGPARPPMLPLAKQELYDEYPADRQITHETPRTFLVMADNDLRVPTENLIRFYRGLKGGNIPAELHIFMTGGHGFAIRNASGPIADWPAMCREWFIAGGLL